MLLKANIWPTCTQYQNNCDKIKYFSVFSRERKSRNRYSYSTLQFCIKFLFLIYVLSWYLRKFFTINDKTFFLSASSYLLYFESFLLQIFMLRYTKKDQNTSDIVTNNYTSVKYFIRLDMNTELLLFFYSS